MLVGLAIIAGCVTRVPSDAAPSPTLEASDEPDTEVADASEAAGVQPRPDGFELDGAQATTLQDERIIDEVLANLTLTERIGQRFIVPVRGTRMQHGAGRAITRVNPAGFIVYPWNFQSTDAARQLIESIDEFARLVNPQIAPIFAADQEGGRVAAFRGADVIQLPSAATLGRIGDPSLIRAASYAKNVQLRDIGVNMNLAPVLDVYAVPDGSIIGDRSFGGDPEQVAQIVGPYLEAAAAAGVIATAKHFPGHGATTTDSHLSLPILDATRADLEEKHLLPFVEAIERGVPAIMTAHLLFSSIDPDYPVTLSEVFLHRILREELGFDGVVISDGLEMGAIRDNYSIEVALERLIKNDVDLILLYRDYDIVEVEPVVRGLLDQGLITEEDINRGVRRVLRLKQQYGLLTVEAM